MNNDFSAQIAAFKKDNIEIVTGVVIPPDAKTFLTQAKQQGFKPKVVTLGKALLFPAQSKPSAILEKVCLLKCGGRLRIRSRHH
jgi:ABC-type branched-subunit amino acid transport system substrate-binding protein